LQQAPHDRATRYILSTSFGTEPRTGCAVTQRTAQAFRISPASESSKVSTRLPYLLDADIAVSAGSDTAARNVLAQTRGAPPGCDDQLLTKSQADAIGRIMIREKQVADAAQGAEWSRIANQHIVQEVCSVSVSHATSTTPYFFLPSGEMAFRTNWVVSTAELLRTASLGLSAVPGMADYSLVESRSERPPVEFAGDEPVVCRPTRCHRSIQQYCAMTVARECTNDTMLPLQRRLGSPASPFRFDHASAPDPLSARDVPSMTFMFAAYSTHNDVEHPAKEDTRLLAFRPKAADGYDAEAQSPPPGVSFDDPKFLEGCAVPGKKTDKATTSWFWECSKRINRERNLWPPSHELDNVARIREDLDNNVFGSFVHFSAMKAVNRDFYQRGDDLPVDEIEMSPGDDHVDTGESPEAESTRIPLAAVVFACDDGDSGCFESHASSLPDTLFRDSGGSWHSMRANTDLV
jgi:hypothetical protein